MPVLSSLAPKSTLRHRPIGAQTKREEPPRVPRASRTHTQKPTPATTAPGDIPAWKPVRRRQRLLLVGIGIGMILAVGLVLLGQLLIGWVGTTWDDLHYGYPRTYQTDAVVGHGDSAAHPSHFLALNLAGRIEVIELPGGDASHAKIYLGPHLYGSHADLVPVTLRFVDTRHDHHPDMLVLFQGTQLVFRNARGTFEPPSTARVLTRESSILSRRGAVAIGTTSALGSCWRVGWMILSLPSRREPSRGPRESRSVSCERDVIVWQ